MRLEATSPFEGEDGQRQQSLHPQGSFKLQWDWITLHESFDREGKKMDGSAPMMIMVTKPQDELPWTRIILPQAGSFLEGHSGIQDGDRTLTCLGITWRTVIFILSL